MTVAEIIYDVFEIKSQLTDDSDLDEFWVLTKVNTYRQIFIALDYQLTHIIRPSWLQRIYKTKVTKINSADDPSISLTSINLGKVKIPKILSLPEDLGLYRITGSSGISQFQPIDLNTLIMKIEIGEEHAPDYGYMARVGNDLYLWPLCLEISGTIIAENPFDIKVNDNGVLRDMRMDDEYPIDADLAQKIVLEILTKDLALNDQQIGDIINDSQSELKILRSTPQQANQPNGNSGQQANNG